MLGPAIPLALPEGDVEFACPRRGWKNEDKDETELLYGFDDGPSEKGRRLSVSDEGSEAFVEPRIKEVELMLSTPDRAAVDSDRVMVDCTAVVKGTTVRTGRRARREQTFLSARRVATLVLLLIPPTAAALSCTHASVRPDAQLVV